jgi:hypothetical protein
MTADALPTWELPRLNFRMPDFTRCSWVSDRARSVWEPRAGKIVAALLEAEWRSVASDLRACCLQMVLPDKYPGLVATLGENGLEIEILRRIGIGKQYSASLREPAPGEAAGYWSVIGHRAAIEEFRLAYERNDSMEMGRLLGYPECCARFFDEVWTRREYTDTTWPMAHGTRSKRQSAPNVIEIGEDARCNILLRWLGPRPVFHLPCRFDCDATRDRAGALAALCRETGRVEELRWLDQMLRWPVEWSALHGIAEIKTPVVKVVARTDATPGKYVVRYLGSVVPDEGAHGLSFPFQTPKSLRISGSKQYQEGLNNPIVVLDALPFEQEDWYFTDNGFFSRYAMDVSHRPILDRAHAALAGGGGNVLDLGCGNAALLRKLQQKCPGIVPWGVDLDPIKVRHAGVLLPEFADHFAAENLFEGIAPWPPGRSYALVILMVGRLCEVPRERADRLVSHLRTHASQLLVYAYEDYLREYGSLEDLVRRAGLSLRGDEALGNVAMANLASGM